MLLIDPKDVAAHYVLRASITAQFHMESHASKAAAKGLRVREAEAKARAIQLLSETRTSGGGNLYLDLKMAEAREEVENITSDAKAFVSKKMAEAEVEARAILSRVAEVTAVIPVFQLQKSHYPPGIKSFPEDPHGRKLRGLGRAVFVALAKTQFIKLTVRSSDGTICVKGYIFFFT